MKEQEPDIDQRLAQLDEEIASRLGVEAGLADLFRRLGPPPTCEPGRTPDSDREDDE